MKPAKEQRAGVKGERAKVNRHEAVGNWGKAEKAVGRKKAIVPVGSKK